MEANVNTATQSVIAPEMEVIGTLKTSGPLRIEGRVEGEINCGGDVVIGKGATIKGNLSVNSISVAGTVNGNIVAKDRIEMKSTARVNGDIKARRLAVEDGVTFIGKSEVNPATAPAEEGGPPRSEPVAPPRPEPAAPDTATRFFSKR